MTSKPKQPVAPPALDLHIRWMIRRDYPDVLQIEAASFDYPWTEEDFLRCLSQDKVIGMVCETKEPEYPIAGFMIYQLHKHSLNILNFAVAPAYRRRGVGSTMVAKLIGKLSSHRRERITLEVRETNMPTLLFFQRHGFLAVKVLRGFYEDSGEDAIQMEYQLPGRFCEQCQRPVGMCECIRWEEVES